MIESVSITAAQAILYGQAETSGLSPVLNRNSHSSDARCKNLSHSKRDVLRSNLESKCQKDKRELFPCILVFICLVFVVVVVVVCF